MESLGPQDKEQNMKNPGCSAVEFVGRLLIAQIFLLAGFGKIMTFNATQSYMTAHHVPDELLFLVIAFELVASILLIIGLWTRWVALLLALFCVATALFFHSDWNDGMQNVMFMKNLAMCGGLLIIAVHGAKCWSVDAWCCRKNKEEPKL